MTNQQINIAIAEACGWTECEHVASISLTAGYPPFNKPPVYGTYENGMAQVPNYAGCLNAMHEAVSIFDYDQADEFEDHLCDICKRLNDEKENPAPWKFAVVNATAAQRAEAFLRTIGKWEEKS